MSSSAASSLPKVSYVKAKADTNNLKDRNFNHQAVGI